MTRVFVYGSLLRGGWNHHLLEDAAFVGDARTARLYTMHSLGRFPGVTDVPFSPIYGEVYDVDDETLARLDMLEGHPRFYQRRVVLVLVGRTPFFAYTYLLLQRKYHEFPVVTTGSWREFLQQEERP